MYKVNLLNPILSRKRSYSPSYSCQNDEEEHEREGVTHIHAHAGMTRNSMKEKEESLTFIHMQREKGRVTRNSMNE